MPAYNLNLPNIEQKFENMFLAYVTKGTLHQKVAGHKFTLVSDNGYSVYRSKTDPSKVLTAEEAETANLDDYEVSDLKYGVLDKSKDVYYAEIIISAQIATDLGFKPGDMIPPEMFEMVGVRIPTQDKHSMAYMKVVDILPGETGNQIILPAEIIRLSGADFDIDSEFVRISEFYRDDKDNLKVFGDYKKAKDPVSVAFEEFKKYITSKDKRVVNSIKEYKIANNKYVSIKNEIARIDFAIENLTKDFDKLAYKDFKGAYTDFKEIDARQKESLDRKKQLLEELKDIEKQAETAALNKYNYPTTVEAFKGKYGAKVDSNVKAYQEGKLSEIDPITVSENNNMTLELEKLLIYNNGNSDIATSPADDKLGTDFIKKYYNIEGKDDSDKFEDPGNIQTVSSPTDLIKANDANSIGKDNIGIAAVWNILTAYLNTYSINLRKDFVEGMSESLKGSKISPKDIEILLSNYGSTKAKEGDLSIRVVHVNSTQITFAVDNAQKQYAAYFNLTTDTLGPALVFTTKGISFERAMLMNIQPGIEEAARRYNIVNSDIKTKIEESYNKTEAIKGVIAEYVTLAANAKKDPSNDQANTELTVENLYQAKLFSEGKPSMLSPYQFYSIQMKVLSMFDTAKVEAEQLRNLGDVLSLIRSGKTDFVQMNTVDVSLKNMGVEIFKKPRTEGTSMEDFDIRHTKDYKDNPELYPYDLLPVLQGDDLVYSNIRAYAQLMNDSKAFFITQTDTAREIMDKTKLSFKERNGKSVLDYPDNAMTLKNHLLAFLSIRAYRKLKGKKFSFDKLFAKPGELTPLQTLHREVIKNPELRKNKFVKYIATELTDYTDKKSSMFFGLKLQKFIGQSRIKKSPDYQRILSDAYKQLASGSYEDSNTAQLARQFAYEAFEYLLIKDAGLMKNKSFIQQIEPMFFKTMSDSLDIAHRALRGIETFENAFGMTKEALVKEFVEQFSRYETNSFNLKSNNSKAIIGNIRQTKIEELKFVAGKDENIKADFSDIGRANEIYKYLSSLGDKEVKEEALDKLNEMLPLKIDRASRNITIDLFAGSDVMAAEAEEGGIVTDYNADKGKSVVKSNFKALLSTGLFVPLTVEVNGKPSSRIGYPEFISVTFEDGRQVYKLTEVKTSKRDKSKTPNRDYRFGYAAQYVPVYRLGTKEALPYAVDLADQELVAAKAKLEVMKLNMPKTQTEVEEETEKVEGEKTIKSTTTKEDPSVKDMRSALKGKERLKNESLRALANRKDLFTDDMPDDDIC